MTQEQRRAVWGVLLEFYDDPAETDIMDRLSDDFASYQADAMAWANEVGPSEEAADVRAIGKDCRQLAAAVGGVVEAPDTWPREMCARLHERLQRFPNDPDVALYEAGVDVWPLLQGVGAWILRPRYWADNPSLVNDLLRIAEICEACPPLKSRTKPNMVARARFVRAIRAVMDRWPPNNDTTTERNAMTLALLLSLEVPAPKRL